MILINIGRQSDGCTYQLHPQSRVEILQRFPGVRPAPSVFVGYETQTEFEEIHGPMWPQIASMLTGLTKRQINQMGGVRLYDPVERREIAKVA